MTQVSLEGLDEPLALAVERARKKVPPRTFLERVGELVGESGELLTPEVAALVVLDELGLGVEEELAAFAAVKPLAPDAIEPGLDGVVVEGEILGLSPTRTFSKRDGTVGFVAHARVGNELGMYEVTLWDEHIQHLLGVPPGARVRFEGLYTKERMGKVEIHTGRGAVISVLSG